MQDNVCYCSNIDDLCKSLGADHDHTEWRLFINFRAASLKAVLLSNGVEISSVSLVHAFGLRKTYNTMELSKLQTVTLFRPIRLLQCSW